MKLRTRIPPDLENMNKERALWADKALRVFVNETGTDRADAVSDLLADLMHWCDRQAAFQRGHSIDSIDFDTELARAREHYAQETKDLA